MWPLSLDHRKDSASAVLSQSEHSQLGRQTPCCKESQTRSHGEWRDHIREVYMTRNGGTPGKAQNQPPDIWVTSLSIRVSQPQYHWHFRKDNSFRGGSPVYYRIFSSIPGLYPVDVGATLPPQKILAIRNDSRLCQCPMGIRQKKKTLQLRTTTLDDSSTQPLSCPNWQQVEKKWAILTEPCPIWRCASMRERLFLL